MRRPAEGNHILLNDDGLNVPPASVQVGVPREVTVVFVNLRRVHTIAAALPTEDLTIVLNAYLTEMTRLAYQHGGAIDRFVGGGIKIIFSLPLPLEDHAARAVKMALEMQRQVPDLASSWYEGAPTLDLAIGINTGPVYVRRIGCDQLMSYTAVGRSVSLAAHLERQARAGQVLITQETLQEVSHLYAVEPLEAMTSEAFESPLAVYNVVGLKPPPIAAMPTLGSARRTTSGVQPWKRRPAAVR